ncbi:molybdopterin-dependent oxidoreductase [Breoghania sp.]|uniref:molybdopterin-dependent oxidoreductase n=1 Tax=Breoghania sp. TaxID=2065378 RepID=UPI0026219F12|nr:molybdopterin-dependent oxidoreductase [Breoghania sp.]MDJ0932310.1 molybdopterin-dependent oxidoreductase [Breoghania sp.]
MAAIAYHMITNDKVDKDFLDKYAVGYEPFRKYILGEDDGVKKTTEWASKISDLPVETIEKLATYYADTPKMKIDCARGIQRCDHGEQAVRMVITLALLKGEMGLPGGGMTFEIPGYAGRGDWRVMGREPAKFQSVFNLVKQAIVEQRLADALMNQPVQMVHNGKSWTYPLEGKSPVKLGYWMGGATLNQHDQVNLNLKAYETLETIIVQDSWWHLPRASRGSVAGAQRHDPVLALCRLPAQDPGAGGRIQDRLRDLQGAGQALRRLQEVHDGHGERGGVAEEVVFLLRSRT